MDKFKEPEYKSFAQTLTGINDVPDEIPIANSGLPEPDPALLPSLTKSPIGIDLWEALAYDLALDNAPKGTIAEAYSITVEQLDFLLKDAYFSKMLEAKKCEVTQLGEDADFVVKMRTVVSHSVPKFLKHLNDPNTSAKDFHSMFKTAVELAKLVPQADNSTNTSQVISAAVTFNIQGVPGLEHLSKQATDETAINQDSVIDADFSEVAGDTDQLYELQEL